MAAINPNSTHKRTSSAAGNENDIPEVKRQVTATPKFVPFSTWTPNPQEQEQEQNQDQLVYIVMVECSPQYSPETTDIRGVFASIDDANNAVRRMISEGEFSADAGSEAKHGTDADGTVWWTTYDAGEGEAVRLYVKSFELQPPGSESICDWGSGGGNTDDESFDTYDESIDADDESVDA